MLKKRRWRKALWASTAILMLAYLTFSTVFWFRQDVWIFIPEREIKQTPSDFGIVYQELRIPSGPLQERMEGWWLPRAPDAPAVLFLHGNTRSLGSSLEHALRIHTAGASVLMIDYRGFGRSEGGQVSERSLVEDAETGWMMLSRLQPNSAKRFLYGHSLGGALALDLASKHADVAGLVVESSFTSMTEVLRQSRFMRILPLSVLLKPRFDSLSKVKAVHAPLLIVHGAADDFVPPSFSLELYTQAREPKTLLLVPKAGHSDASAIGGVTYQNALRRLFGLS